MGAFELQKFAEAEKVSKKVRPVRAWVRACIRQIRSSE
jgi:hypothetical protein